MKYRLLDWLACPNCRRPDLRLQPLLVDVQRRPHEVRDGLLACSCGRLYPIVRSIPRMLPDSFLRYRSYLAGLGLRPLPEPVEGPAELAAFRRLHESTRERFGFEWLRYEVTDPEEDARSFRETTGFLRQELEGRKVLDAGCGMGRYLKVAARSGAEVVGIDLSESVERAWCETGSFHRVHLVQGDLLQPPFRAECFDFAYSIGVLHHTPDPRAAFRALSQLICRGGRISIWVYPKFQPEDAVAAYKRLFAFLAQLSSDGARLITTRMPHRALHYVCYLAVPLGWLKDKASRTSARRKLFWPLMLLPISSHEKWQVRLCDTFDWLAPTYQFKYTAKDIAGWFREEGFFEVKRLERPVSFTGVRPVSLPPDGALPQSLIENQAYAAR